MSRADKDVADRIRQFNKGREAERLALKYAAMRKSAFAFLRGACHLFYEDLPKSRLLSDAPVVWACGDLHLENFGSYKGDNRLVYFDLGDFDESLLAPCTWDLLRLLASILVAAETIHVDRRQARALCRQFLKSYVAAIQDGKARWIEREIAEGLIGELLDDLKGRNRKRYLDGRTELDRKSRTRKIRVDGVRALAATPAQKQRVRAFMAKFSRTQPDPGFFRVLDVARRIAGTGSLGVQRYVLLVEGKGSPDRNYLLDLKQSLPSALASRTKVRQPRLGSEAQRIVTVQQRVQAISMAFLHPVTFEGGPYVLRGLQPSEDRVTLDGRKHTFEQMRQLTSGLGKLVAWGELRSSGRQGSATVDELAAFWKKPGRPEKLLDLAARCADQTQAQWKKYREAYDQGKMETNNGS